MNEFSGLVEKQRQFFLEGHTLSLAFRLQNLERLQLMIHKYEREITEALYQDLHKSDFEAYATEIGFVLAEIRHARKHLRSWSKPVRVSTPLTHFGTRSRIYYEPYGVSLILSPWNYPFQLAIAPMVGAMAAGNCVILKPSEFAQHSSALLNHMITETFPKEYICVVEGDVQVGTALLEQKFDYIFFTGSTQVGKRVMEAAAKHLTPVTLELGGKSPCIVHSDANLKLAAKRIAWGKFLNAGQTCIAPDYVLVQANVKDELIGQLKDAIQQLYGNLSSVSPEYTHIVNERHFQRLLSYLQDGRIVMGGEVDPSKRFLAPTILDQVSWDAPVMQEEIFGPILPVLEYENIQDAIRMIQDRPKPLALYLFSDDSHIQEQIVRHISFGGGCINDTIFHIAQPNLPFGGVGDSGIGAYHGKHGFELFSHKKSVLKHTTWFDLPIRYHTGKHALKRIKWFLR
jgi:aldehyde dehydrogenase (NAD+)